MSSKAFKCPKCHSIQIKSQYCIADGFLMEECEPKVEISSNEEQKVLDYLIQLENKTNQVPSALPQIVKIEPMNTSSQALDDESFVYTGPYESEENVSEADRELLEQLKCIMTEMLDNVEYSCHVEAKRKADEQKPAVQTIFLREKSSNRTKNPRENNNNAEDSDELDDNDYFDISNTSDTGDSTSFAEGFLDGPHHLIMKNRLRRHGPSISQAKKVQSEPVVKKPIKHDVAKLKSFIDYSFKK
jgi:hypothetical protein